MKDKHLEAAFEEITNIIMSEFPPTKQGKLIKQTIKHYGDMRVREVVEETTFDACNPHWIKDDPAWSLVAIKSGKVVFEVIKTAKEIKSIYHQVTDNYASDVVCQNHIEKVTEHLYIKSLSPKVNK